jgi:multiple sugar transport system ATP-binding protein
MAAVVYDRAERIYPGAETPAVKDLDLEIEDGEFMVLVGPSGCGKSTSLRMLAGLEEVTAGHIRIGDRDVTDLPPKDRDIAMVFQNYALYPHMSVADNMAFALKMAKVGREERRTRVEEAAKLLGLEDYLDRKPKALSGGQRQRVAMGRAIVRQPQVFCMDEPLSNLDAKLRVSTRTQIAALQQRLGVTTVYVTHDQVEAMTLGQRVAVMRDGLIQQVDRPQTLYHEPTNLFVAAFIGSPSMNLVDAVVDGDGVEFGGLRIPLARDRRPGYGSGPRVILGIRPGAFEDAEFASTALPQLDVEVAVLEELGNEAHAIFPVDAPRVEAEDLRAAADDEDQTLMADDERALFNAQIDPRTKARPGARLRLAVDPAQFHFFDPDTGDSLTGERAALAATSA